MIKKFNTKSVAVAAFTVMSIPSTTSISIPKVKEVHQLYYLNASQSYVDNYKQFKYDVENELKMSSLLFNSTDFTPEEFVDYEEGSKEFYGSDASPLMSLEEMYSV